MTEDVLTAILQTSMFILNSLSGDKLLIKGWQQGQAVLDCFILTSDYSSFLSGDAMYIENQVDSPHQSSECDDNPNIRSAAVSTLLML